MERIAQLLARHRLAVALCVSALTLVALYGTTLLEFDDDPRNLLRTNGEVEFAQLEQHYEEFGSDDNDCVLVIEGEDLFSPNAIAALRELVAAVREVPGVDRVLSIFDAKRQGVGRVQIPLVPRADAPDGAYAPLRERALKHPLVAGQLVSADGQTMLVVARLSGVELEKSEPVVAQLHQITARLGPPSHLRMRLTGIPAVRAEVIRHLEIDTVKFNVLAAFLALTIALLVFRQWSAVIIAVTAPAVGAVWLLGGLGLLGIQVNVLNSVVPTLVLVVGLTDSIHFLLDIQRSRAANVSGPDASTAAVNHVGAACGLTSLTSAVGFASLSVARADLIRQFGLVCAVGSLLTFVAVLTIVPLLASTALSRNLGARRGRTQLVADWANAVVRTATLYPLRITVAGIVTTLVLGYVSLRLEPDSWLTENLLSSNESSQALAHCDEVFGGVMFVHALVEWPASQSLDSDHVHGALQEVDAMFRENSETRNPLSVLNVVDSLPLAGRSWAAAVRYLERGNDSLQDLLRLDRRRTLVSAHVRDIGLARYASVFDGLQKQLTDIERRHPGMTLRLAGTTVVSSRQITGMIRDLGSSLGLESLVIFGLMTWSFRSLGLGLISIIPNIFPLVCVAALMVALDMPLQFGSVIVFNICLGLAVDDTIHVMTRFEREMQVDGDVCSAIRRSFAAVGTAVLTTTAILLAGFSIVMLSDLPALRLFGALSCVTILSALVGELIFTPALLLTFLRRRRSPPLPAGDAVLPLAATPFEQYMRADDRPEFPMTIAARLSFQGRFDRAALEAALCETVARHPLLGAHLKHVDGRLTWVDAGSAGTSIEWLDTAVDRWPGAGYLDLARCTGLRAWVAEDAETSNVYLEVHHACCDGAGLNALTEDLLSAYALRVAGPTLDASARRLDARRLSQRGKFGLTFWKLLKIAPKQCVGLFGVRQFLMRRPIVLGRSQFAAQPPQNNDDQSILTDVIDPEEYAQLHAAARRFGVTRNDLLIRDLFLAVNQWQAMHWPGHDGDWFRMSIPMNLRGEGDEQMPAANIVSMVFLDRRPVDVADPNLLDTVREEMGLIKRLRLSLTFVLSLAVFRRLPGGMTSMTSADQCRSSIVLSNAGRALVDSPLPRQQGRVVAGNVVLESIHIAAPLRPLTTVTVVVVEYAGQLCISLRYHPLAVHREEAEELLSIYASRLGETARSAGASAARTYEEAT